jgi:uncharacterized protein YuzE
VKIRYFRDIDTLYIEFRDVPRTDLSGIDYQQVAP